MSNAAADTCGKCGGRLASGECKLCPMFAAQQPPGISTEATFLAGMYHEQSEQFNGKPEVAEVLARDLRAAGGSTTGKVYLGSLAAYPGDPRAWVSGKDDIALVARERNYGVRGAVRRKRDGRPEPKILADEPQRPAKARAGRKRKGI